MVLRTLLAVIIAVLVNLPVSAAGYYGSGSGTSLADSFATAAVPFRKAWSYWVESGTTLRSIGVAHPNNGTASASAQSSSNFVNYASAGTTDSTAGWLSGGWMNTQYQFHPIMTARIRTGATADSVDITACRIKVGFTSNTTTEWLSDSPATSKAQVQYCTVRDGTAFWRCVTNDQSGSETVTVTTVAVVADTDYEIWIDARSASSIVFWIGAAGATPSIVATHTTDLPVAGTTLIPEAGISTTENVAKNIRCARIFASSD